MGTSPSFDKPGENFESGLVQRAKIRTSFARELIPQYLKAGDVVADYHLNGTARDSNNPNMQPMPINRSSSFGLKHGVHCLYYTSSNYETFTAPYPNLNPKSFSLSFNFQIEPPHSGRIYYPISFGRGYRWLSILFQSASKENFTVSASFNNWSFSTGPLSKDGNAYSLSFSEWHNIILCIQSNPMKIYSFIDGIALNAVSIEGKHSESFPNTTNDSEKHFGFSDPAGGGQYKGFICDFMVFNTIVNPSGEKLLEALKATVQKNK